MEDRVQVLLESVIDEDFFAWLHYAEDVDSIKDPEIREKAQVAKKLASELMDAHEDFVNVTVSKGYQP